MQNNQPTNNRILAQPYPRILLWRTLNLDYLRMLACWYYYSWLLYTQAKSFKSFSLDIPCCVPYCALPDLQIFSYLFQTFISFWFVTNCGSDYPCYIVGNIEFIENKQMYRTKAVNLLQRHSDWKEISLIISPSWLSMNHFVLILQCYRHSNVLEQWRQNAEVCLVWPATCSSIHSTSL